MDAYRVGSLDCILCARFIQPLALTAMKTYRPFILNVPDYLTCLFRNKKWVWIGDKGLSVSFESLNKY